MNSSTTAASPYAAPAAAHVSREASPRLWPQLGANLIAFCFTSIGAYITYLNCRALGDTKRAGKALMFTFLGLAPVFAVICVPKLPPNAITWMIMPIFALFAITVGNPLRKEIAENHPGYIRRSMIPWVLAVAAGYAAIYGLLLLTAGR